MVNFRFLANFRFLTLLYFFGVQNDESHHNLDKFMSSTQIIACGIPKNIDKLGIHKTINICLFP